MTQIIIAIALWCGEPNQMRSSIAGSYTYTSDVVRDCRTKAFQCMEEAKWAEAKLGDCLGRNLK